MIEGLAASLGLNVVDAAFWMPLLCLAIFLLIVLLGLLLDGFDLGATLLLPFAQKPERDRILAMLSPWRDMNEFWLLFGAILFLTAFPKAWALIFSKLYMPLVFVALGAICRHVACEFHLRAPQAQRSFWLILISLGSVLSAFGQGWVLGKVAVNFQTDWGNELFALFIAISTVAMFMLLGATWLVMRSDGSLQQFALTCARRSVRLCAAGLASLAVSLALVNTGILYKWLNTWNMGLVILVWALILSGFILVELLLSYIAQRRLFAYLPFILTVLILAIVLLSVGFSYFPFFVYDDLTVWESIDSVQTLSLLLFVMLLFLPILLVCVFWIYRDMFGGERKASDVAFTSANTS